MYTLKTDSQRISSRVSSLTCEPTACCLLLSATGVRNGFEYIFKIFVSIHFSHINHSTKTFCFFFHSYVNIFSAVFLLPFKAHTIMIMMLKNYKRIDGDDILISPTTHKRDTTQEPFSIITTNNNRRHTWQSHREYIVNHLVVFFDDIFHVRSNANYFSCIFSTLLCLCCFPSKYCRHFLFFFIYLKTLN